MIKTSKKTKLDSILEIADVDFNKKRNEFFMNAILKLNTEDFCVFQNEGKNRLTLCADNYSDFSEICKEAQKLNHIDFMHKYKFVVGQSKEYFFVSPFRIDLHTKYSENPQMCISFWSRLISKIVTIKLEVVDQDDFRKNIKSNLIFLGSRIITQPEADSYYNGFCEKVDYWTFRNQDIKYFYGGSCTSLDGSTIKLIWGSLTDEK